MRSSVYQKISILIHGIFALIWIVAMSVMVFPILNEGGIRYWLLLFGIIPIIHLILAYGLLKLNEKSLIGTVIIFSIYVLGVFYYGLELNQVWSYLLIIYNIVFPILCLRKKEN